MKSCLMLFAIVIFSSEVSAAKPAPLLEATTQMDTMVLARPIDEIQKALPSYLELAPQEFTKKGTHPVFLIYATQMDLKYVGAPKDSGMNYNEAITMIPYVRVKGEQTVFNYMAQLHLDDLEPIYLGLRVYGYLKDLAKVTHINEMFYATDPYTNEVLFDQTTVLMRKWNEEYFRTNWEILTQIMARPLISNLNGDLICSIVEFKNYAAEPVQAYVELGSKGVPGLKGVQKSGMLVVPGLDEIDFEGGVRTKSTYTLSAPVNYKDCVGLN